MPSLTVGSRGPAVLRVQKQLQAEGTNPGTPDGIFGNQTRSAVEEFQRDRHLPVDGVVGPRTARALGGPPNRTARIDELRFRGQRNQMALGQITINNHIYEFTSGGRGRGNLPKGSYQVTPHLWSRNNPSMTVEGVGFSFALSNRYDPRVNDTRQLLRIHPDGGTPGTIGCIGIVGGAEVQKRFREDMRAELDRGHGRFTLIVE